MLGCGGGCGCGGTCGGNEQNTTGAAAAAAYGSAGGAFVASGNGFPLAMPITPDGLVMGSPVPWAVADPYTPNAPAPSAADDGAGCPVWLFVVAALAAVVFSGGRR